MIIQVMPTWAITTQVSSRGVPRQAFLPVPVASFRDVTDSFLDGCYPCCPAPVDRTEILEYCLLYAPAGSCGGIHKTVLHTRGLSPLPRAVDEGLLSDVHACRYRGRSAGVSLF
jgi:hypothetical protein